MNTYTIYKGHTITKHLTGWYSTTTLNGIVKADTLKGIKKLINENNKPTTN